MQHSEHNIHDTEHYLILKTKKDPMGYVYVQRENQEEKVWEDSTNSSKEFAFSIKESLKLAAQKYIYIYLFITREVINYPINLVPLDIRSGLGWQ